MVPATLTSSLFMGTDSFFAEEDSFFGLAAAAVSAAGEAAAATTPRPFCNRGTSTNVVITYATAGMSTAITMSGSQALKPPDAAAGAAAAVSSADVASSGTGAFSVRLAGAGMAISGWGSQ